MKLIIRLYFISIVLRIAKDLKNKHPGTSDPYATVHILCKNEKQKDNDSANFRITKVENANLNPKWNEVFTM